MAHSPQKVHFPKSIQSGFVEIALAGHSSINSSSLTFSVLITGLPLNMPGTFAVVTSGMYCLPWWKSIFRLSNIFYQLYFLQIMTAITQVKAFITNREIRYFIVPHCKSRCQPVMKRGIFYFIKNQFATIICNGTMANFSSPSFHQRNGKCVRSWV